MAKYFARMQRTADTTLAVGSLTADGTTPRRAKIFRLEFGSEASPADNPFLWQLQRQTTVGTASTFTPVALDSADAAALDDVNITYTTNGTLTANAFLLSVPLNQRATYQWQPAPGGELVVPATASNGIGVFTPTASAVGVTCSMFFEEQ
jgi:hypothetical protein